MTTISFFVPEISKSGRPRLWVMVDGKPAITSAGIVTEPFCRITGHAPKQRLKERHFVLLLAVALEIHAQRQLSDVRDPRPVGIGPAMKAGKLRCWQPEKWEDEDKSIMEGIRKAFPFRGDRPNPIFDFHPTRGVVIWNTDAVFEFSPSVEACREYVSTLAAVEPVDRDSSATARVSAVIVVDDLHRLADGELQPIRKHVINMIADVLDVVSSEIMGPFIKNGRITITLPLAPDHLEFLMKHHEALGEALKPLHLVHIGPLKEDPSILRKIMFGSAAALGLLVLAAGAQRYWPYREPSSSFEDVRTTKTPIASGPGEHRSLRVQSNATAFLESNSEIQLLHDGDNVKTIRVEAGRVTFEVDRTGRPLEIFVPDVQQGIRASSGRLFVEQTRTPCQNVERLRIPCPTQGFIESMLLAVFDGMSLIGNATLNGSAISFQDASSPQACTEKNDPAGARRKPCTAEARTGPIRLAVFMDGTQPSPPVLLPTAQILRDSVDWLALLQFPSAPVPLPESAPPQASAAQPSPQHSSDSTPASARVVSSSHHAPRISSSSAPQTPPPLTSDGGTQSSQETSSQPPESKRRGSITILIAADMTALECDQKGNSNVVRFGDRKAGHTIGLEIDLDIPVRCSAYCNGKSRIWIHEHPRSAWVWSLECKDDNW